MNMREVILCKLGEMVLKGLNRGRFEKRLADDLSARLRPCGNFKLENKQSTVYVIPADEGADITAAYEVCRRVFGIVSVARAGVCEKDAGAITAAAQEYLGDKLARVRTFKVECKRSDKKFPLTSIELSQLVGGDLNDAYENLTADMHSPELTVRVEIRETAAYVHAEAEPGAGGLPAGINGRATVMISGGIDSPVAAWMMARRGIELHAVHFFSYPYTSEESKEKVLTLLRIVAGWSGAIKLHIAPFTDIQEEIRDNCPEELFTIIMRRFMVRVAQRIAENAGSSALITGESLGQVASQTLPALVATDAVADMPIFRPLIGMDKNDIVKIARHIGTFDTSILPYEDCCTVFTPKHPALKPSISAIEKAELRLNIEELVEVCARTAGQLRIEN
jgi:thiamine biosynthesis protein ThiI